MKIQLSNWTAMVVTALVVSSCGAETSSGSAVGTESGDPAAVVAAPAADPLTGPQRNAVRSARNYLSLTGFSRDGLIDQLSSEYGEGYTKEDATVAVDSLDADWNASAVKSARAYLEMTGFSCNGLIEQLSSRSGDKYTEAQAKFGAEQAGAC